MTDGYQHLWANTYGAIGGSEYTTWAKAIDTVDPKRAMQAIADVLKEGADYPPNLIKFLRICRQTTVAYHQTVDMKSLPAPDVHRRPEVISAKEKHQKAAKELLGMNIYRSSP